MNQLIQTLPGSNVHRLCIQLYQRHYGQEHGRCAVCGQPFPCVVQRHAALVIHAAGEDPRWYEGRSPADPRPRTANPTPAGVTGYHLGGHGRRSDVPYVEYER